MGMFACRKAPVPLGQINKSKLKPHRFMLIKSAEKALESVHVLQKGLAPRSLALSLFQSVGNTGQLKYYYVN